MDRRSKHVGKSERDRGVYVGRLVRAGYSSTAEVEEQLPLTESALSEEELSFVSPGTRRPRSLGESVKEHFGHNWIYYVMTLVMTLVIGLVIAFIAVVHDFSVSLGRIEGTLDGIKNNLDAQENKIEDIEDKIHDQELKLQEQGIKMDYLEKELEETQ